MQPQTTAVDLRNQHRCSLTSWFIINQVVWTWCSSTES